MPLMPSSSSFSSLFYGVHQEDVLMQNISPNLSDLSNDRNRLHLAASVFTYSREAIVITDASGCIVDVNESFARISGYTRAEVLGKKLQTLKIDRQDPEYVSDIWNTLQNRGYWSGELWNRAKDGKLLPELLTINEICGADGTTQHYVALSFDITSFKEHEEKLKRIALYDQLTGLPNRSYMLDKLQHALQQSKRRRNTIAIVSVDLDHFKEVNDTYGHSVGDALLVSVGNRMVSSLRETDTFARIGGDEFIGILTDLQNREVCIPIIERLRNVASEPVLIEGHTIRISASIGVTFYHSGIVSNIDQLLKTADFAMYKAKHSGKNCYHIELEVNLNEA